MPEFGNFQTLLLLSDEDARSEYLAERKVSSDNQNQKYVVVVFRVRKVTEQFETEDQTIRDLGQDLQLAFISAIKAQKRAYEAGSTCVAPVYEAGINSEGAWYATDHYPQGTLEAWVRQKRVLDQSSLRSIIAFILDGLRDLQRFSGRSHGDLTLSKVLIPGKNPKLRRGVRITEPLPGTEADAEQFEQADLRALGAMLYQLVTLNLVRSPDEITIPVPATNHWSRLGEHGPYWIGLCNKLLANPPQHSLESLASELPPPKPTPKWKIYAAAAAVLVVLIALWLHFSPTFFLPTDPLKRLSASFRNARAAQYLQTKSEYLTAMTEAREQADWGEFSNSRAWLSNAISLDFRSAEAERFLQSIITREARFNQYLIAIPQLIAQMRYADAVQACSQVRRLAPKSARIDAWDTKAGQAVEALQDFKEGRYAVAERKFDHIWQSNQDDLSLKEMRDKSSACAENWGLFDRTKQTNYLQVVLIHNPADTRAQEELKRATAAEGDYREYFQDGREFFDGGDYPAAVREFEWAVSLRNDPIIKRWLDESKSLQQLREKADGFFAEKQWPAAETNYAEILRRNSKDSAAQAKLKECQRARGGQ